MYIVGRQDGRPGGFAPAAAGNAAPGLGWTSLLYRQSPKNQPPGGPSGDFVTKLERICAGGRGFPAL